MTPDEILKVLGEEGPDAMIECRRCNNEKPRNQFTVDKRTSNGISYWCRECTNTYAKERRQNQSAESLIAPAIACIYPRGLPEDRTTVDYYKLVAVSGAPLPAIRLAIMRKYIEIDALEREALRIKNEAEFQAKQTPENKAALFARLDAIRREGEA